MTDRTIQNCIYTHTVPSDEYNEAPEGEPYGYKVFVEDDTTLVTFKALGEDVKFSIDEMENLWDDMNYLKRKGEK